MLRDKEIKDYTGNPSGYHVDVVGRIGRVYVEIFRSESETMNNETKIGLNLSIDEANKFIKELENAIKNPAVV